MIRAIATVAAAGLAGCIAIPDPAPAECGAGEDGDGDGWACDGIVPDCDDADPTLNPGEIDAVDDGLDQDCFLGDRRSSDALEEVAIDDADRVVTTPALEVVFDDVSGLPQAFSDASHVEISYAGADPERVLGVSVDPDFFSSSLGFGTRTVPARGPALVEVVVDWDWTAPPPESQTVSGTTRLRFFPERRVYRVDHVELDASFPTFPGTYHVSSYSAWQRESFTHVDWWLNDAGPIDIDVAPRPTPLAVDDSEEGWLCVVHEAGRREVGWAWKMRDGAGPRLTIAGNAGDERIAFEYDWQRMAATADAGSHDAVGVLTFGNGDDGMCFDTYGAAQDLQQPPSLAATLGGGTVEGFDEEAGLYRASSTERFVEIRIQDDPALPGLAIESLLGVETADGVTVWHDRARMAAGIDYLVQSQADGSLLVWIARDLQAGDVIRIAAPGGEEPP